MPLLDGKSRGVIARNIRQLKRDGYKTPQATAIALHHAGIPPRKRPRMKRGKNGRFLRRA